MSNELTERIMGDPTCRSEVYAADVERMAAEQAALLSRIAAYRDSDKQQTPSFRGRPPKTMSDDTRRLRVLGLWDAECPLGEISKRTGLSLAAIYQIVSG
jgi:hypothetical protein